MSSPLATPPSRRRHGRGPALRSRLIPIAALAIGGALLAYAIVSISVGEQGPGAVTVEGSSRVQQLYGGITQEGDRLGSSGAPVTLSVFNDVQCGPCADWHRETIPPLVEGLVRPGDAALELRHFSTGSRSTVVGAFAATAAGEQGAQWQYADLLLRNLADVGVSGVDQELLDAVAAAVPGPEFDADRWRRELEVPAVVEAVEADADLAVELRLPAEPAVVVDGPGGTRELTESPTTGEIEAAVAEVG